MLPQSVQSLVGEVHTQTRPALKLLKDEGFVYADEVDIFDAGPMYFTPTDKIRVISESREAKFRRAIENNGSRGQYLVCSTTAPFHACATDVEINDQNSLEIELGIPRDAALALELRLGDTVRFVPARTRADTRSKS